MRLTHDVPGRRRWGVLAALLAVVFAVALAGSWVTLPKILTWYAGLAKPSFSPPNALFGPVWTVLYAMMAVAAWRVWIAPADAAERQMALALFWLQLVLNALWSPVFFGFQRPGLALAVIVLLWIAIVATTIRFFRIDALAGWLLIPYLAWVTFASVLNGAIVRLNP